MGLSEGDTMGTDDETVTNGFPPQQETAIVCHLHSMSHGGIFCNMNTEFTQKKKSPVWQRQLPEQDTTGIKVEKRTTAVCRSPRPQRISWGRRGWLLSHTAAFPSKQSNWNQPQYLGVWTRGDVANTLGVQEKSCPGYGRWVRTHLIELAVGSNKGEETWEAIINLQFAGDNSQTSDMGEERDLPQPNCQVVSQWHPNPLGYVLTLSEGALGVCAWRQLCWQHLQLFRRAGGRKLPPGSSSRSPQELTLLPLWIQRRRSNFCSLRAHKEKANKIEQLHKFILLHSTLSWD